MSAKQKSITSFFTKSPGGSAKMAVPPARISPVNSAKRSARAMASASSDSDGDKSIDSPIKATKRARKKKAVIESSSEDEPVPTTENPAEVKENDTPNKSIDKGVGQAQVATKIKLKTIPRGAKTDPASNKRKVKKPLDEDDDVSLSFPGDETTAIQSPTKLKKEAVKTEITPVVPKEEPAKEEPAKETKAKPPVAKNPFANFFTSSKKSDKTDSDADNAKGALDFHEAVQKTKYHPISDAIKRKDANEKDIKVQVAIFAFDLLYLNGEALVRKPFQERRDLLKKHFQEVEGEFLFAKYADPQTMEEVQEVLEESVKDKCEGLMVKTLDVDATYEIAKRSHNWLKLKKDYLDGVGDTLDLLVMGGYLGKGKRTGHYGGFLLGCYDPDNEEYQTICKIGTGFSDEDLAQHHAFFKDHLIAKAKPYYSYDPSLVPDHWFEPVQVWEVKAADLSVSPIHKAAAGTVDADRGISLRFPRYIQIRTDKQPEDSTSAQQVADLYNSQEQVKNSKQSSKKSNDDDYDF
ncbi:hypothetical protein TCAL_03022 [Tigriopus californicus]|uniref:DNA ligase 1 n=1 Tax=Tigriopus californicus TaxID=6832 RepID=A0A553NU13_TIGCA|nr:hypothetical protein TCAL_03022 [Tigriopus californicus]